VLLQAVGKGPAGSAVGVEQLLQLRRGGVVGGDRGEACADRSRAGLGDLAGGVLKGQTLPTFDQLRALLLALGVESDAELSAWAHRHQQIAIAKVLLRDLVRRNPGVVLK
jgi:hypothetical protein